MRFAGRLRALFGLVAVFESLSEGFELLEVLAVLRDFGCPALELEGGGRRRSVVVFEGCPAERAWAALR